MLQAAHAAEHSVQDLLRELDPDAIPLCEVPELWKTFVSIARLGESAATLLARRFEEAGTSISQTKRQIETSKKVRTLPQTANAMRKGKLPPAKVEAIAGAANVDPEAEDKTPRRCRPEAARPVA